MVNFLEETIETITAYGKSIDDIDYINIPENYNNERFSDIEYTTVFDFSKFEEFANKIGDYDDGYGSAEVPEGTEIIFKDKSWLSRGEYDGSEWWNYNACPPILI